MKIYNIMNPNFGRVFQRIDTAFHKYAPNWVQWVGSEQEADANLLHIVGGAEVVIARRLRKPTIIFQHCYFTANPAECDYTSLWEKSLLTLSFHNLPDYTTKKFNFFRTPLGYEKDLFYKFAGSPRSKSIFATGHVANTECLDKVYEACKRTGFTFLHTGENFKFGANYKYMDYLNDLNYLNLLNTVRYVAGLRDIEGFEVACIEGAACGAVPIVPDLPTYSFYKNFAHMIDMKHDIVGQLVSILNSDPVEFTAEQREEIKSFTWDSIIPKIYNQIEFYGR